MSFLGQTVRRLLARKGYTITPAEGGVPETLESYLRSLPAHLKSGTICIQDGDPKTIRGFYNVFAAESITVQSGPQLACLEPPFRNGEFAVVAVDLAALHGLAEGSELWRRLQKASAVLVRSKFSQIWSGQVDLIDVTALAGRLGFRFHEVIQRLDTTLVRAPAANIFLAYERAGLRTAESDGLRRNREYRISEALSHLSAPILPERSFQQLTGRGSYGLSAGLYNPGALLHDGRPMLLARGERIPWAVQRRSHQSFASSCQPMLLLLRDDLQVASAAEIRVMNGAAPDGVRHEDFRLFAHEGRIYSNHSTLRLGKPEQARKFIEPALLPTSVGLSLVDVAKLELSFLGSPQLDRAVARVEKNWAMFSSGQRVHLIYSVDPYRLFSSADFPNLKFAAAIERNLRLPILDDGLALRNSINPVPYDDAHFLHVVHKVYPGKHYVFWPLLINRNTLLPAKFSPRPLVRTGAGGAASIVYACSAIVREDEIFVFAGIDDCSIGAWRLSRSELDRHWLSLS